METVFWVFMAVPIKDLAKRIRLASNADHVRITRLLPYFTDPLGPTRILPMVSPIVALIITTEYPINNLKVIIDLEDGNNVWTFKMLSIKYTKLECISGV
jgi:hypothetical protein